MLLKKGLNIILIGFAATVCRIIGQMLIPAGDQNVLPPSIFVENGTMPIAFTIYGVFVYSIIASMFYLVRAKVSGNKLLQGLKYGISCCIVWIVYLLEPLPHVAAIDKITYPLADSAALIIMGLLCGALLGTESHPPKQRLEFAVIPFLAIIILFITGRTIQYTVIDIYSSFPIKTLETVIWTIITAVGISSVIIWWYNYIPSASRYMRAVLLGILLFGVDLLLFNFFMPFVFNADIPDLIIRTVLDIFFVSMGCLFFNDKKTLL